MQHKKLKISLSILALVITAGLGVAIFAPQWFIIATTKIQLAKSIKVSESYMQTRITERELPKTSLPARQFFTEKGVRIGVPFENVPEIKEPNSDAKIYSFGDKNIYILSKPSLNLLESLSEQGDRTNLAAIYGEQAVSSNFEFVKAIYNVTPSDLTFKSSMKDAVRLSQALLLKLSYFINPGTPPYQIIAFHNDKLKGFQVSTDQEVKRALIDIENAPSISLINMTQEEIDSVLNNISFVK